MVPRSVPAPGLLTVAALVLAALSGLAPPLRAASAAPLPQTGWAPVRAGASADLEAVSFSDRLHGHAVGARGTILATNDAGATWANQYACARSTPCLSTSQDRTRADLAGVSFPDQLHGWAVGRQGTILATVDGGTTWSGQLACAQTSGEVVRQFCDPLSADRISQDLTSVSFVDSSHGWAVGSAETMLATADGGRTWVLQIACLWQTPAYNPSLDSAVGPGGIPDVAPAVRPCPPRPQSVPARNLTSVSFVDRDHGVAVGENGWALFTEDGGRNWYGGRTRETDLRLNGAVMTMAGVDDRNQDAIHAVGDNGQVMVSGLKRAQWWYGTPGSDMLVSQSPITSQTLRAVSFTDRLSGHAVGDGGMIVGTSDEGGHWTVEASGTTATLRGVAFPDAHHGYAVGDGGTILAYRATAPGLSVSGVSPRQVPMEGRLPVTITGRGFSGAAEVNFGTSYASGFTVDSDTRITAVAPPHTTGRLDVTVSARGMTSEIGAADQVEVLPPGGASWSPTGRCPGPCDGPAVLLSDGRVLVAGEGNTGRRPDATTSAEIFDPAARSWRAVAPMQVPRRGPAATLLRDGRVLVTGGWIGQQQTTSSAEIYDPVTGRWARTESMHHARGDFAATRLADGEVLVVGGYETLGITDPGVVDRRFGDTEGGPSHSLASAEIYDPATGHWRLTGAMGRTRAFDTAILLRNGEVLVVGDDSLADTHAGTDASAELYDPRTGAWRATGPLGIARDFVTATLLADGRVLASGGVVYPFDRPAVGLPYAEIYDPAGGSWTPTGPMLYPRVFHTTALLADGRVLAVGGRFGTDTWCPPCDAQRAVEVFDPATNTWRLVSPMSQPRLKPDAVLLRDGSVLVTGHNADTEAVTLAAIEAPEQGGSLWWAWLVGAGGGALGLAVLARRRSRRRGPPRGTPRASAGATPRHTPVGAAPVERAPTGRAR